MKILFLFQGHKVSDHPSWQDALRTLKRQGKISDFLNIPYLGYAREHGWDCFYDHICDLCAQEHFNVVYFHYFHSKGKPSPAECIKKIQKLSDPPVVITSVRDGFSDNWMRNDYPQDFKDASKLADITFSTQMGKAASKMIKWGARTIVYTPNSLLQTEFNTVNINPKNHNFDFDIVFVGSNNGNRLFNPISKHWWGGKKRNQLVKVLYQRYGKRFGLFGKGWNYPSAQGSIPFKDQQTAFRRGRIVVGGNPYSYSDYYTSNRVFFEVSSGIPTVEMSVPRFDKVLRNSDHVYFADNIKGILKTCDRLLDRDPIILYEKAATASKYIEEKHTQYHRMKFKIDTVKYNIQHNGNLDDLPLPYFLPEVDLKTERYHAVRQNG